MPDPRVTQFAKVLVHYSLQLKPGQQLSLFTAPLAEELALAAYAEAIRAGAHVFVQNLLPDADEAFYKYASDAQLDYVSPVRKLITETFDAQLYIEADHNTRALSGVDPSRIARTRKARATLEADSQIRTGGRLQVGHERARDRQAPVEGKGRGSERPEVSEHLRPRDDPPAAEGRVERLLRPPRGVRMAAGRAGDDAPRRSGVLPVLRVTRRDQDFLTEDSQQPAAHHPGRRRCGGGSLRKSRPRYRAQGLYHAPAGPGSGRAG